MEQQLNELSEVHRRMVRLELEGDNRKEIGKKIGMHPAVVGRLLLHDEKVDEYRRELVKDKEKSLKFARVRAELTLKGYIEDFVAEIHRIAINGKDDSVRLNASVKGLQFAGMKLVGQELGMIKAPKIIIRDSTEKIEREDDGEKKPKEGEGDEQIVKKRLQIIS